LATVYGIIQQAGEHAHIYSKPDVGTTFTMLQPATPQAAESAQDARTPQVRRGAILLAEDEQTLREVTLHLAGAGYRLLVARGPVHVDVVFTLTGTREYMELSTSTHAVSPGAGRVPPRPMAHAGGRAAATVRRLPSAVAPAAAPQGRARAGALRLWQ
jgi:hypothetical protein